MPVNEHTLDAAAAGALLGMSAHRVKRKIHEKGLPAVKTHRAWRFSRRELLAWQDKQRLPSTPPAAPPPVDTPT